MVHYDRDQKAAQTPPRICPKCGSHRTEVVGQSEDGRTISLRCNACGDRSTVEVDRRAADRASDGDEMTDEIDAIRAVGRALSRLPDDGSRERVLRWAAERFHIDAAIAVPVNMPQHVMASPVVAAPDATLSMDGLQSFFKAGPRTDAMLNMEPAPDRYVDTEPAPYVAQPLVETAPIEAAPIETAQVEQTPVPVTAPAEAPKLDSMVHSFVADFQRLASDWQTVFEPPPTTSR